MNDYGTFPSWPTVPEDSTHESVAARSGTYCVFKYPLAFSQLEEDSGMDVELPTESRPLYTAVQDGGIVLYGLVDPHDRGVEVWRLYIIGTGHPIEFDLTSYNSMGVMSLDEGRLMFHIFISRRPQRMALWVQEGANERRDASRVD